MSFTAGSIFRLYNDGGPFMHVLLLFSLVGLVFIIERFYAMWKARVNTQEFIGRIRTALLQVALHLLVGDRDLAGAIEAPRLHLDGDVIRLEPGFSPDALQALSGAGFQCDAWSSRHLYFGGVHAALRHPDGALDGHGDSRRGGVITRSP